MTTEGGDLASEELANCRMIAAGRVFLERLARHLLDRADDEPVSLRAPGREPLPFMDGDGSSHTSLCIGEPTLDAQMPGPRGRSGLRLIEAGRARRRYRHPDASAISRRSAALRRPASSTSMTASASGTSIGLGPSPWIAAASAVQKRR